MTLKISRILNTPIDSNSYLLYDKDESMNCVIIDPGVEDCLDLELLIKEENLKPIAIIITHEHFDHCCGCNYLQEKYDIPIICSDKCAEAIKSYKSNLSMFFLPNKPFVINGKTQHVKNNDSIELLGKKIIFIETPGHTSSSITILIDDALFTGDTLIKGLKTVTKLPSGSKELLAQTFRLYSSFCGKGIRIYPGHGDSFELDADLRIMND